jgi:hypothetical protein
LGDVLVVAGVDFEAAVEGADEPVWKGAGIVFRWGPPFPATGASVFR